MKKASEYKFIGLLPRVYALAIDLALYGLLLYSLKDIGSLILSRQSPLFAFLFYLSLPQFFVLYLIIFHTLWGQSLGKMLVQIKIYSDQFSEIGLKQAILRESMVFALHFVSLFGFFVAFQELPSYYASPELVISGSSYVAELIGAAQQRNPFNKVLTVAYVLWVFAIILTTTRSRQKRSINDKIGGTVLLKTNY